jgi:glucokinase
MAVLAVDLGGTKLATAVFEPQGEMLHRSVVALGARKGAAVGRLIQEQIRKDLQFARRRRVGISVVGVSVPGIAWRKTGKVWAPNIPGWEDYPLRDEICVVTGKGKIPVRIEGDRACYILGETWQGAAKGCKNAIFLAVGTGIGAGILVDGRILSGAHDIAGAIGWLALDRPYLPKYGPCGCFEHHASGEGIARVARELIGSHKHYAGVLKSKRHLTARDVFAALVSGDAIARKTLRIAVEFWGMAVANLVSLFNPEKIIFGGGVFGPADQFLDDIYREAKRWAQPISIAKVKLEISKLGGDAGLYGAGFLALRDNSEESH